MCKAQTPIGALLRWTTERNLRFSDESEVPMVPPFDVFVLKENGPNWLGPAETLDEAFDLIRQAGAGSYVLFSMETGLESFLDVSLTGVVSPFPILDDLTPRAD
jgi:hypothetical protein